MKRKIYHKLLMIAAMAIITTLLSSVAICYQLFGNQVIDDLRTQARVLERMAGGEMVKELTELAVELEQAGLRVTVIAADGRVVFDSGADEQSMDNHRDRPEIKEAWQRGEGWAIRRSDTRDKNTFYYAMTTDDGTVLRVSREAGSIFKIYAAAIPIMLVVTAVIFGLCALVAGVLSNSLIKPVKVTAANLTKNNKKPGKILIGPPLPQAEGDTYEELQPLLDTIREQNESLLSYVKIRQDFTANVSHELKTPLTSISGYAELIENRMVDNPEDITRFAAEIHSNANRLLTLINDIIRLSELDSWEKDGTEHHDDFETVDLFDVAQSCVNILKVSAAKHQVTIGIEGEKAYVSSTRQMMEELIFNLCDNAIRYNKENGTVKVSVWKRGHQVILTVNDSGIGISQEHQERIFERFYRVDKSRSKSTGGTGLGLAIVKHILARHGAELELSSESGKGTQITVTIPDQSV